MQPCDHEDADTRLVVHLVDAVRGGHTNFLVRTVDTDVIVIIMDKFFYLSSLNPSLNIWVAFGKGKHFTYLLRPNPSLYHTQSNIHSTYMHYIL